MKKKLFLILRYPAGILLFLLGALLSGLGNGIPSMILFLLLMLSEIVLIYMESGNIIDLRLLLSLSWLFGISISSLKLSNLQSPWSVPMWFSTGGFYFLFLIGFDAMSWILKKRSPERRHRKNIVTFRHNPSFRRAVFSTILILTMAGLFAFLLESIILDFRIPIFAEWSYEAYSEFHVTGLHYFCVSLVLVTPLSVYYLFLGKPGRRGIMALIICNGIALLVPFLILSKMQMLLTLALPAFAFLVIQEKIPKRIIMAGTVVFGILVIGVFVVLMRYKNYPEGYLQSIFQFKKPETPLTIQYPYTYIVNNFENLNLLTLKLQHHSFGIRELFPFFALTGLKFLPKVQTLLALEQYTTIPELTTLTVLYHVYGDFGTVGAFVFGLVLGGVSALVTDFSYRRKSAGGVLLYVQIAFYMALSFFTTWFSDATTWFYFIATAAITIYIRIYFKRNNRPAPVRRRRKPEEDDVDLELDDDERSDY